MAKKTEDRSDQIGNIKFDHYKGSSSRTWEITLNNPTEEELAFFSRVEVSRILISQEVGDSGTPHLQGRVTWKRAYTWSALHKLAERVWWSPTKAKSDWNYALKVGSVIFREEDNRQQGARTDLYSLKDQILTGKKSVNEIVETDPVAFHQYGRTLERLETIYRNKTIRTEMTGCVWYWGPTGVGKSHIAFQNYSPETHYNWTNDRGWWDGYAQQETVIMNDFRGEIEYAKMLKLIDKFPETVIRRGKEPINFTSKRIIVTSSKPPEEIYRRREFEDKIEQLMDRIEVVHIKGRSQRTVTVYDMGNPDDGSKC